MKRQLWGEFSSTVDDADSLAKQNEIDQEIMDNKRGERTITKQILRIPTNFLCNSILGDLKILKSSVFFESKEKHIKLLSRNDAVNQIVGLKQRTTMIQELIDGAANDHNFTSLLPTLKETLDSIPRNITTPNYNDKFNKICFIPPVKNDFTLGKPKNVQKVNKTCVQHALRKSICGLTCLTDYTNVTESALTMFMDAVHIYLKSLTESIVTILTNEDREAETEVDLVTFERAYFALTGESTTTFFNYFKREIQDKHNRTVNEFHDKVDELKNIVESQHQTIFSDDFYQHNFFIKEEIKQEEDYDDQ